MSPSGSFSNVGRFLPKLKFVRMQFKVAEATSWVDRLEKAGIDADTPKPGRLFMRLSAGDLPDHEELVRELVHQAVTEYEA